MGKGKVEIAAAILITGVLTSLFWLLWINASTGEKKIKEPLEPNFSVADPEFLRSISLLLGPEVIDGNKISALQNGDEILPAMLSAIRAARKSITFETYIYWSGTIGREFAEALADRAKSGVQVHVLLDWAGSSKIDNEFVAKMEAAGVEIERFHPLSWHNLSRLNNRTHRKLLIVDGKIGFTGGVGIADKWTGHAEDEEHWRDSHYMVEGPAVAEMQAAFIDNWIKVRGCILMGPEYFPKLEPAGTSCAQVFKSSRDEGSESVRLMYLLCIGCARKSIRLAAAYFVPDDLAVESLAKAQKRGVKVEIIVPGPIIDSHVVRRSSRARWGKLLEAGVSIYEYQPTMFHCKVLIVDELWVSVGSTNFDNRSFRLNAEANLNIKDADFAKQQIEVFEKDKSNAVKISLEKYNRRPLGEKVKEKLSELLRSQL